MHGSNEALELFTLAREMPFNDVHFWRDPKSQLEAIVVIHSTQRGPALGGCRYLPYPSCESAIFDALRLAKGMTYKAAINHLPFGGGKSVILKPATVRNRKALFESFGEFVNSLNGRYITAMDSGTNIADMDIIYSKTPHVVCASPSTSHGHSASGDPSPYTAKGVYYGIKAAVKFHLQEGSLSNIHVAIQGLGHVGYHLAKLLYNDGAKLSVSDIKPQALQRVVEEFSATAVSPEDIFTLDCDVFSPCALGQAINNDSLKNLNTTIIAGSANDQLQNDAIADTLFQRGILYAPDFVINSGGILQIAYMYDPEKLLQKLQSIDETLTEIFTNSSQQRKSTVVIANHMAESALDKTPDNIQTTPSIPTTEKAFSHHPHQGVLSQPTRFCRTGDA